MSGSNLRVLLCALAMLDGRGGQRPGFIKLHVKNTQFKLCNVDLMIKSVESIDISLVWDNSCIS